MTYHCKAVISYEFTVDADTADDAEQIAVEGLADDIIIGTIRTDLFTPLDPNDGFPYPSLDFVEVKEASLHESTDPWEHS